MRWWSGPFLVAVFAGCLPTFFLEGRDCETRPAPVASAGPDRVVPRGVEIGLDGSDSIDYGGELAYGWTQVSGASPASLTHVTEPVARFQASTDGAYLVRLTVYDGCTTDTDDVVIEVGATTPSDPVASPHRALPSKLVDAEYSKALDRLILVAAEPSELWVVDPWSDAAPAKLSLTYVPYAVGLTPDGLNAVVGHNGWVTYVRLDSLQKRATYTVPVNVGDVVATATHAHVFPSEDQWVDVYSVRLSDGLSTLAGSWITYEDTRARLHPSGTKIYGADNNLSPSDLERYDFDVDGVLDYTRDSPYHGDYPISGDLWFTATGDRILTRSGLLFWASDDASQDMRYAGAVEESDGSSRAIVSASHSGVELATIGLDDAYYYDAVVRSHEIRLYDGTYFSYRSALALPTVVIGGKACAPRGRFVFHSADARKLVVVLAAQGADKTPCGNALTTLTLR